MTRPIYDIVVVRSRCCSKIFMASIASQIDEATKTTIKSYAKRGHTVEVMTKEAFQREAFGCCDCSEDTMDKSLKGN